MEGGSCETDAGVSPGGIFGSSPSVSSLASSLLSPSLAPTFPFSSSSLFSGDLVSMFTSVEI